MHAVSSHDSAASEKEDHASHDFVALEKEYIAEDPHSVH